MGFFDFFKRLKDRKDKNTITVARRNSEKKRELTPEELLINKMWDLWAEEKLPSPVADLMLYQAEVNNGGHDQFFFNLDNSLDDNALAKTMAALRSVLTGGLLDNLERAYAAFKSYDDDEDGTAKIEDECDDYYYDHEDEINLLLEKMWADIDI